MFHFPGLDMLPNLLISVLNDNKMQTAQFINVLSCVGDLQAFSSILQAQLAIYGDTVWDLEVQWDFLPSLVADCYGFHSIWLVYLYFD